MNTSNTLYNPLHPGEIVKDALIDGTGLTITHAAERLGVSRTALSQLINGHAAISAEMALRLAKFLNTSIEMWINIQAQYDAWRMHKKINSIKIKAWKEAA